MKINLAKDIIAPNMEGKANPHGRSCKEAA